ncbi:hypothetical protein AB4Y42_06065 [Paraburkholderia sp. EG286B]|uniref:hypothetical protein n=1 Tax=Paraburkholderia sp. EG286B TaxID=3237011 RepID=UPI0034D31911
MTIHAQTFECITCHESKPFEAFYADRSRRDGKRRACKLCDHAARAERKRNVTATREIAKHLAMHAARKRLREQLAATRDNIAAPVSISTAE